MKEMPRKKFRTFLVNLFTLIRISSAVRSLPLPLGHDLEPHLTEETRLELQTNKTVCFRKTTTYHDVCSVVPRRLDVLAETLFTRTDTLMKFPSWILVPVLWTMLLKMIEKLYQLRC